MKLKNIIISSSLISSLQISAQWLPGGNNTPPINAANNIFGTFGNFPVRHITGGTLKFTTTVNSALSNAGYGSSIGTVTGDGIRISQGPLSNPAFGTIDFFTTNANQTHIKMGSTGLFQTANSRLEFYANANGFWFNATGTGGASQHIWSNQGAERGRLGNNGFWRFGANVGNANANNIIEIVSQASNPYGITGSGLRFRNLTSANIATTPTIFNGINTSKVLSVDNNGDVVLINSGFGALCSVPADIIATQFTASRAVNLNTFNFEWRNGRVGFGTTSCAPGNRVEITGLAAAQSGLRFTNLTSVATPIVNPGAGVLSVDGNGDVIYVPSGLPTTGNNGISVTAAGVAQLGVPCSAANIPAIIANQFSTNRMVANRNFDFWFASLSNETGGVGIGGQPVLPFCGTGNTFEVSANSKNLQYGSNNASGVRFTKLIATSPTIPNGQFGVNSSKVLTVDGDGDVVLTDASISALGNICGATTTQPLLNDWEIPLNGKNYTFSDPTTLNYGENTVRIGAACNNPIFNAKLEVIRSVTNFPSTINTLVGIGSVNSDNFPLLVVGDKSYAGYFLSDGGNVSAPTNYSNYGVVGIAKDARTNYGGYFEAKGPSTMGYGIFAKAFSTVPGAGPLAGYFDGDVIINGPFTGYSNQVFSDKNIKTNVTKLTTTMDLINKLRPVSYKYDNSYVPQLRVDNQLSYGFIAQEVGNLIPELVRTIDIPEELDSLGNIINPTKSLSTLNYNGLIPFAISGIQELNAKQREMEAVINKINLSDAQVKTNVTSFNALATVKTLSPVKYNFTNANVPQLSFKTNTDYGFIAQQLETVYPELIDTIRVDATFDSLGVVVNPSKVLKTVNYKAISALLVRSIQEQQLTIDSLRTVQLKQDSINQAVQQQLAALLSQINACCSNSAIRSTNNASQTALNQLDVELSDKNAVVLNQNVPNPFAEQTTITYNVPASFVKAQLLFYNGAGQIIQTVDITTRGKGKVNVFASDLSSGLYHYTLVVDGKVADSKKMVRE